MRIRQIRPEFFTDPVTAHLPAAVQVTYVGLWCYADDSGWLAWDVDQIGALLYPYKSIRVRTGLVKSAGDALADIKRLVFFDCGCAWIPTLAIHHLPHSACDIAEYLRRHGSKTNMLGLARGVGREIAQINEYETALINEHDKLHGLLPGYQIPIRFQFCHNYYPERLID